ncbi:leukotriene B4 receptor 1-like isoform X1 [Oncorhynchus keta]|uniref:leukotriene B4 receptor 1-like isoform X1 n=2 Tax=Oncorhynchus keta TaxID=8018 RepID=UPI0015F80B56|nr:leukotriene B4 receptor 1-like isoform X1 [Oncorhynchus keta]
MIKSSISSPTCFTSLSVCLALPLCLLIPTLRMESTAWNTTTYFSTDSSAPNPSIPYSVGISFLLVAMALGLPGNLLVVWTILFRLSRRSITSLLILQLAAADALVLLSAPFFIHQLFKARVWEFGEIMCKLLHYVCGINMYLSILLITLMGVDRLHGVLRPFWSQRVRTKSRLFPIMGVVWALASVLPTPQLVYRQVRKGECTTHHPGPAHQVFHYSLETVTAFLVPFSIMTFCYLRIAHALASSRSHWHHRSYRKTNRLITLIVVTFALLWAPYHLVNILQVGAVLSGSSTDLLGFCLRARTVVIAVAYLSSAVNPLLYTMAGSSLTIYGSSSRCLGGVAQLLEGTASNMDMPSVRAKHDGSGREKDKEDWGGGKPEGEVEEMTMVPGKREVEDEEAEQEKEMTIVPGKEEGN